MKTETIVKIDGYHHRNESCEPSSLDQSISRASYMCRKCKVHGKLVPVKRHKRSCLYLHCKCIKCLLVDQGRKVVAKQIALYRDQRHINPDDHSEEEQHIRCQKQTLTSKDICAINGIGPHCRRCRNHNVTVIWKNHKKTCPYRHCPCDPCRLINVRKDTEKTLRDMQIVTDESTNNSRNKNSYPLYGGYSRSTAASKSPNTSYNSVMEKSNFDLYPRSSESSLSPSLAAYYNNGSGFMGPSMSSTFQRLVSSGSTAGDLSHLANISSPFSNTDRFCSNSDFCSTTAFKSLGSGFMMNGRSQANYQTLDCPSDMWSCLNPARSMMFSSYNMVPEYCSPTYSYLNSLGMSSQEHSHNPLAPLAPMLESTEPENSSGPSMYRGFPDCCY